MGFMLGGRAVVVLVVGIAALITQGRGGKEEDEGTRESECGEKMSFDLHCLKDWNELKGESLWG